MQPLARLGGHRKAEAVAAAAENGSKVAILSSSLEGNVWASEVLLVDVASPVRPAPVTAVLRLPTTAACLLSLTKQNRFFAGGDDGCIYNFATDGSAKAWATFRVHHAPVSAIAACDGSPHAHLASVDLHGGLALWTSSGSILAEAAAPFAGSRGAATSVAITSMATDAAGAHAPVLVSGHRDGSLAVQLPHADAAAASSVLRAAARCEALSPACGAVTALCVIPSSRAASAEATSAAGGAVETESFFVAGYEDGSLALLEIRSPVSGAAGSAASAGESGWSISLLACVAAHKSAVRCLAVAPSSSSPSGAGAGAAGVGVGGFTVISGSDDTAVMATRCAFAHPRLAAAATAAATSAAGAGSRGSSRAGAAPVAFTAPSAVLPGHAHHDYVAAVAVLPMPAAAPALPSAPEGGLAAGPAPATGAGYAIASGSWDGTVLLTPVVA